MVTKHIILLWPSEKNIRDKILKALAPTNDMCRYYSSLGCQLNLEHACSKLKNAGNDSRNYPTILSSIQFVYSF